MKRTQEYNEKAVSGLYHSSEMGRTILNELASLPSQKETLLDSIEKRLKDHKGITRRGIVDFFKKLESYGVGEFIPGRRGHSSRFRWDVDSVNVSTLDVAFPTPNDHDYTKGPANVQAPGQHMSGPPHHQPRPELHGPTVVLTHQFQLRPDLVISINLPTDVKTTEVHRLCKFLETLPFGE